MLPTSTSIRLLAGTEHYAGMPDLKALVPFDSIVLSFLNELSIKLTNAKYVGDLPDVLTFGFFIRKANVNRQKNKYTHLKSNVGRGVSFHIAPSNVPVNFAFSLVAGLLSGNACIVRASSKNFKQTNIICNAISSVLESKKFSTLKKYISIVKYNRNSEINSYFSSLCDIRVLWGGDETITELRRSALPPRAFDIAFSDRYSFCIIKAEEYLNIQNKQKVATDFYNDTYLFDQNACSSPRLIYWVGNTEQITQSKQLFWSFLHDTLIAKEYNLPPIVSIKKYAASCQAAIDYAHVGISEAPDNLISRIELNELPLDLHCHTCEGGSYFEYSNEAPDKLFDFVTRKFQTLTYVGFSKIELTSLFTGKGALGIDRIVPNGKAADFSFTWDGYDLISHMSRVVKIE